jgi:hypothetical protein
MIVGRRDADGMCLRVAQAYESAVGGFPRAARPLGAATRWHRPASRRAG